MTVARHERESTVLAAAAAEKGASAFHRGAMSAAARAMGYDHCAYRKYYMSLLPVLHGEKEKTAKGSVAPGATSVNLYSAASLARNPPDWRAQSSA